MWSNDAFHSSLTFKKLLQIACLGMNLCVCTDLIENCVEKKEAIQQLFLILLEISANWTDKNETSAVSKLVPATQTDVQNITTKAF